MYLSSISSREFLHKLIALLVILENVTTLNAGMDKFPQAKGT